MRNIILASILIVALLIGFGTVIFYNIQSYEYNLDLKETIPTSDVYVTLSPESQFGNLFGGLLNNSNQLSQFPKTIQSISMTLGEMSFENKGSLSRVIEIPRLVACADLSSTPAYNMPGRTSTGAPALFVVWPIYSVNEPIFKTNTNVPRVYSDLVVNDIFRQYNYGPYSNQPNIEIKKGDKITYYVYLKDVYLSVWGENSSVLKNAKIEVYSIPIKNYNPLSEGVSYDSLIYNPTCEMLVKEFEPIKTIEIV